MYKFNSQTKGLGQTFDVVLFGGSPWGFTLQGGSEFKTKLSVLKVTPGGKADLSQAIAVGDEIVAINGIECQSRQEAIELVKCSRQKLSIALKREGGVTPGPANHSNGAVIKKRSEVPNLYKTASELLSSSDFYSTFNVDKKKFAEITKNKKPSNIYDSSDNLSASHENLLESYRQGETQPNISNSSIMEETSERLSRSSTEIANGRTSPAEVNGLSGVSLPEGHWPVMHQRTLTSPGRIQKVMVKSTNIAVSPTGREADNQQTARNSGNSKTSDDWVGRWLKDAPQHAAHTGSLDYRGMSDRKISGQERSDVNKSQSLPRSKSFGGPTSYGVTVTAMGVKWNESSNAMNHARGPQRYSSSNLMQEKQLRDARPNDTSPRQSEMPWNSLTYAAPGDTVEVRLPRDITGPKMTLSESTSSLDSVGTMDSSVGGARRQGPAPPPRRSVSKLLSSFRTHDRRRPQEEVHIPPRFGAVARIPEIAADQPKHSVSRSWPTDHVVDSKPAGSEVTRQSWHAEPPGYSTRGAHSSMSSTSSDVTPERKLSKSSSLRYSSSVVIRSMRSSSSSSFEEKSTAPTVYRSRQAVPEAEQVQPNNRSSTLPPRKKPSDVSPPIKSPGDVGRWPPQNEREAKKGRIEDTQILQRLMKDNVNNAETSPSVKSRIANLEGGMKQSGGANLPLERHRSFSQGKIDIQQQPLKEPRISQSSSMDSLLETRSPARFSATFPSTEQQISQPIRSDSRPTKQWETINYSGRGRSDENYKRPSHTFDVQSNPGNREPRSNFEPSSPARLERQQSLEEQPYIKSELSARDENKVNSAMEFTTPVNDKHLVISNTLESDLNRKPVEEEPGPPSNNDENEVFWDADDSFPPPPPLHLLNPLETSQDSLPLPSPPPEVLVEFPPPYHDYDSRRNDPVEKETYHQNGKDCSDMIKPEENVLVESSVEIIEEPKIELNGPRKIDTSGVSEQAFETSSSTDLSSKDTSPAESKKMSSSQRAPPPPPLVLTSTPTKDERERKGSYLDVSTSPYSGGSNTSTPFNSRPNSVFSPKLVELDKEKADLVESMKQKIIDLRSQMDEIKDEIDGNEELGQKVTKVVEQKASEAEFSKYQRFTGELNKIIGLLLILTQRMHRYEMMLNDLDMSEEADRQQRDVLQEKIEKVALQHEEACKIKEVNDKRGEVVSKILENCLEEEEFADFQYYIDMKTQLALMHAEIRDKVKMGEERLNTLHSTKIDWSILSLS